MKLWFFLWSGGIVPLTARAQEAPLPEGPRTVSLSLTEGTWMNVDVHRNTVVFDLLGDLWTVPLNGGGAAHPLTTGSAWEGQPRFSPDGRRIAYVSDAGGTEQIWIMRSDGSSPRPLTRDPDAQLADPVWDPDSPHLLARRTSLTGGTALWRYPLDGGPGEALTSSEGQPLAGEAWVQDGQVWFSSRPGRPGSGDADPVAGLWQILRLNLGTGALWPVVSGVGSAARPALSPDGRLLAFVSRDRERTVLELLEVSSGKRRILADWLSADQLEGAAIRGVYPAIDWTTDGSAVVLWARGKLWRVDLLGGRVDIPFLAEGTWSIPPAARPLHPLQAPAAGGEAEAGTAMVSARVLRWPVWGPEGQVAFSALGALWLRTAAGELQRLSLESGFSPAWRPDGHALAWTTWTDPAPRSDGFSVGGGALFVGTFGWRARAEVLPLEGLLVNPAWSRDGRQLVVLRGVGDALADEPTLPTHYEVVLLTRKLGRWSVQVVTTLARQSTPRAPALSLHDGRVWSFIEHATSADQPPDGTALVSVRTDGTDLRTHLLLPPVVDAVLSPDFSRLAYRIHHRVFICGLPALVLGPEPVPPLPPESLSCTPLPGPVAGTGLAWIPDGTALSWSEGSHLYTRPVDALLGDISAATAAADAVVALQVPRPRTVGTLALLHARLITMEGEEILEDATVVIQAGRITAIAVGGVAPPEAEIIDCTGMTVIPGLIDVDAWGESRVGDILPEQEWRYQTALDFGVTTLHDTTAPAEVVLTQAERIAAGEQVGPRVFSSGAPLALPPPDDPDVALREAQRLRALGALGLKVPAQASRIQRQQLVRACQATSLLCVLDGGGDLWRMLSAVADGFAAIEGSFPTTPVYADVLQWWAASEAVLAPSLLRADGGLGGESFYFQYENPLDNPRLLRHHPRRPLDQIAWRRPVLARDWRFQSNARDVASLAELRGDADSLPALVALGSQGRLQGLGVHWELWSLAGPGAMTPHQALRTATIDSARYLGLHPELGSIAPGKRADLVVLSADPLQDIRNTLQIALVIHNGAILE